MKEKNFLRKIDNCDQRLISIDQDPFAEKNNDVSLTYTIHDSVSPEYHCMKTFCRIFICFFFFFSFFISLRYLCLGRNEN